MTGERQLDLLEHVASFSVEPRDYFESGYLPHPLNGPVLIQSAWELHDEPIPSLAHAMASQTDMHAYRP